MRPVRFAITVAAACAAILAVLAAMAVGVWASLPPAEQATLATIVSREMGLILACALLFATLLAFAIAAFLGRYAIPARRLAAETALIASANPGHRVDPQGAPELREVGEAVNALAERYGEARRDVEETARRARADVEEERNRLAALMAELTQAVLVCNLDGRILLYNEAARALFGREGRAGGFVGLGRSVFGVVDRGVLDHALDTLRERSERGDEAPVRFVATADEHLLRAHMSPVRDRGGHMTGFVLTAEDVTETAVRGSRRDALLRGLSEGSRAGVANIRAAAETMLEYPELDAAEREHFLRIVHDEAVALSRRIEEALASSADFGESEWALDEMRGSDLLAALRRSIERDTQVGALVEEGEGGDLWLTVESHSLVGAVTGLVERLRAEGDVSAVRLGLAGDGGHARLDVGWDGPPLDPDTLRGWEEAPLSQDGPNAAMTVREVLERHAAEAWSQSAANGGAIVRLLLPRAPEPPRRAERARPAASTQADPRPEFYDFELLRGAERESELDERPLAELAYTVFDTETTGLNPAQGDELISIGALRIVNGRLLTQETFEQLIDPGRPVPEESTRIHGISPEMLAGQPRIGEVLPRFARFAEDTVLVGHNVAFDMRFFALKEEETGVRFTQPVLDTLLLSAVVHPDHEEHSLEAQAARLGISVLGRHTALGDAILTAEIFVRHIQLLEQMGLVTLGKAREAARQTYQARVSEQLYAKA